jgi:Tol biopolymer transport system component
MVAGMDGITLAYFDVPTQVNGDRGPGYLGWVDDHTIWYQSEKSGYSHLYTLDTETGRSRDLTPGHYEVLQAELSPDHRRFFIITNQTTPGDRRFYQLDVATGHQTEITSPGGGNEVVVSCDG